MKQLFIKLLRLFGLVPAGRHEVLARQFEQVRLSAQTWKASAGEASDRVKALEGKVAEQARLLKEAQRARSLNDGEAARLREQLLQTERALRLAREHLMAVEVKLDILEGAANVLDERTRVIRAGQGDAVVR